MRPCKTPGCPNLAGNLYLSGVGRVCWSCFQKGTQPKKPRTALKIAVAEEVLRPEGKGLAGLIETHPTSGTCCIEPSCNHGWHGQYSNLSPADRVALQCEGCGWSCGDCRRKA